MNKIHSFSGSPETAGGAYGQRFQREIAGFFTQEFGSYRYSRAFVRACLKIIEHEAPTAFDFIAATAKHSLLSLEEHILLLLHEEELYHRKLQKKTPHCTAVGSGVSTGRRKGTVLGQNWDWSTAYYPWSAVVRIALRGQPRILSLSYPGLPVCAGVNSSGLGLVWTGAGYYPPVAPRKGIPTYALTFEVLLRRSVAEALEYLQRVSCAGAFIFFLGDRSGEFAIVEGTSKGIFIERTEFGHRANIFENAGAIATTRQQLPGAARCHSIKRNRILAQNATELRGRPSLSGVKSILSLPNILIERSYTHATLMQLLVDCGTKTMHFREWRQQPDRWKAVRVV